MESSQPIVVVRPTTTYHALTGAPAALVIGATALSITDQSWTRWPLAAGAALGVLLVINRARARVLVTRDRLEIGHELGTRRLPRGQVRELASARDGVGWSGRVLLDDGSSFPIAVLAAFRRVEADLAVEDLRDAMRTLPIDNGGADDAGRSGILGR